MRVQIHGGIDRWLTLMTEGPEQSDLLLQAKALGVCWNSNGLYIACSRAYDLVLDAAIIWDEIYAESTIPAERARRASVQTLIERLRAKPWPIPAGAMNPRRAA